MKVTVIIPSLNPDEKLICVVDSLIEKGFNDIVLVNDGSDSAHMAPFEHVGAYKECHVLTHEINKGKGRALKTAFEYCIANRPDIDGVVTVDGDNQHKANDIYECSKVMCDKKDTLILGVRDFSGDDVPKKSKFGNNITSAVFKFACGLKISDTQTGLRAIPAQYLQKMCEVTGERFEYETNMLLELKRLDIPFDEVKIETVYIEENASTHFHPIKDSFKIYAVIFKFLCSSMASSIIDIALFAVLSFLFGKLWDKRTSIFMATIIARVISSMFNYTMNRKAVFKSTKPVKTTLTRYYILCVCQMLVSAGLVYIISELLTLGNVLTVIAKFIVDVILFTISFRIQRAWVF